VKLDSLNLGCGYRKKSGFINLDNRSECQPDICCDITYGLPFSDSSIETVFAVDFLEHIPIGKTVYVIEEIWRVLIPNGVFYSETPSTDGRGAFQDPTHVSFWNLNSWMYFMNKQYRDLYGITAEFKGLVYDKWTDKQNRIIHTIGELNAIK